MNKIFRNLSLMLVAGTFAASCADYNETSNFKADPDPEFIVPYKDLAPVKTYIDRQKYPNMSLGAQLKVSDFNKQELAHAAAITNFDNVAFGTTLMSGSIVNAKGVMNFLDMMDLLDHAEEINAELYGSPIVANANQADEWLATLTAPIEIPVDYVEGKVVNYNDSTSFNGTMEKPGNASIAKYDNQNTGGQFNPVVAAEVFLVAPSMPFAALQHHSCGQKERDSHTNKVYHIAAVDHATAYRIVVVAHAQLADGEFGIAEKSHAANRLKSQMHEGTHQGGKNKGNNLVVGDRTGEYADGYKCSS